MAGAATRPHEHGVGRERALGIDAFAARGFDRRRNDGLLLVAEQAAFAGMRIEPGDRDAWWAASPGRHRTVGDAQGLQDLSLIHI